MKDKRLVNVILGLLIVQFVLGMLANLYASVPKDKPYLVFHQFGYIMFHALNGTLLVILGIILVVKNRKKVIVKPAIGGLVNLLLAFTFGELFVFTHHDIFSLLMALAFIGALMTYARIAFSSSLSKK